MERAVAVITAAVAVMSVCVGCTQGSRSASHSLRVSSQQGSMSRGGPSSAIPDSPASRSGSVSGSAVPSSASGGLEAPTSTVGICKIAQPAQIAAAFGGAVAQVSAGTSGVGHPQCRFALSSSNLGLPGVVALSLNPGATAQSFDQARTGSGGELVGGIGDQAFWVTGQTELAVLKGASMLVIQATIKVPAAPQPQPAVVRTDAISLGRVLAAQI